jgi:GH24 family phage-related lysozyme (muramidase)
MIVSFNKLLKFIDPATSLKTNEYVVPGGFVTPTLCVGSIVKLTVDPGQRLIELLPPSATYGLDPE